MDVYSLDLAFHIPILATNLDASIRERATLEVSSHWLPLTADAPAAVTLKVPRTTPRVTSFTFPESPNPSPPHPLSPSPPRAPDPPASATRRITRIKPPGDTIKLADRLYYVLQPPLETLL